MAASAHHDGRAPAGLLREIDSSLKCEKHSGITESYAEYDFSNSTGSFNKRVHVAADNSVEWETDSYYSANQYVNNEGEKLPETVFVQYSPAKKQYRVSYHGTNRALALMMPQGWVEGELKQVKEVADAALKHIRGAK